jgi:apolipoprotein N-acyltransferase
MSFFYYPDLMKSMFLNKKEFYLILMLPVFSGALIGISLLYISHWVAWIMLVSLFYAVILQPKAVFLKGFIAGTVSGLFIFSWMIASARMYTGTSPYIGYPLWLMCSVYFGLVMGITLKLFSIIKINNSFHSAWWLNALIAGSVWIIIDWIRLHILPGLPWLSYPLAFTQSRWILPLQITSFTGIWGLTFVIVVVNVLIAYILIDKNFKHLWLPVSLIGCLLLVGVYNLKKHQEKNKKPLTVALICENTEAKTRWLPETADSLALIFLNLNKRAEALDPQVIIWSESAIPWNLALDDKLIIKCLSITWPSKAGHIIGIFTPSVKNSTKRYNSAYYIEPDGAITSRYDKVQLLSFLEHPFAGAKIPFFRRSAITDIIPGKEHKLLKTNYGNAGILICNEIISRQAYCKTIRLRPHFMTILSNDAWFEGSMIPIHHFFCVRLRAVESGKNVVINCNCGVSGIIHSNGVIQISEKGSKPTVISGYINLAKSQSFYARKGDWYVILAVFYLTIIIVFNLFITKKNES